MSHKNLRTFAITAALALLTPLLLAYTPASKYVLTDTAQTISGLKSVSLTAAASTAETLASWTVSDATGSTITIINGSSTDTTFDPQIRFTRSGTASTGTLRYGGGSDTGTNPVITIDGRIATSTAVATRPLMHITNAGTVRFTLWGNGDLTLGSTTGPLVTSGAGTPEGSKTAVVGSLYLRTDGGAGTSIYIKESGSGNTGWVAK